jgi:ribosomal protein S18 acetylase RimI-like enzyme
LEDLYVKPLLRGKGIGLALLKRLAGIAAERGYGRMEWGVLHWNKPSIEFYQRLGAAPMDEWIKYRLTGDALEQLALQPRGAGPPATSQPGTTPPQSRSPQRA